ncbi:hypothetical protein NKH70_33050 [Mesorhizobium sp. M0991]|uniref:hypothetical protein n=1 Tax=Mesorhizobium sp. M0991 TaxID=2957043 RepID=UPI00333DB299
MQMVLGKREQAVDHQSGQADHDHGRKNEFQLKELTIIGHQASETFERCDEFYRNQGLPALARPSRSPVKIDGTAEGSTIIVSFDQRLNERTRPDPVSRRRRCASPPSGWVEDLHV